MSCCSYLMKCNKKVTQRSWKVYTSWDIVRFLSNHPSAWKTHPVTSTSCIIMSLSYQIACCAIQPRLAGSCWRKHSLLQCVGDQSLLFPFGTHGNYYGTCCNSHSFTAILRSATTPASREVANPHWQAGHLRSPAQQSPNSGFSIYSLQHSDEESSIIFHPVIHLDILLAFWSTKNEGGLKEATTGLPKSKDLNCGTRKDSRITLHSSDWPRFHTVVLAEQDLRLARSARR